MNASDGTWEFSDAWVLTAIAVHDLPCTLTDVLAAADAMNHAILTDEEVAQAIGRLTASGLVLVDEERFAPTSTGQSLTSRRKGGLMGQVKSVQALLRQVDLRDGLWAIPAGAMDAAFAACKSRLSDGP